MQRITISITYYLKWGIIGYENYAITSCGKLVNLKTMKILKRTLNSSSKGFWFGKKFETLETLRSKLVKFEKEYCPF
jgi:hypothetical protein